MGGTVSIYAPDGSLVKTGPIGSQLLLPKLAYSGTYTILLAPEGTPGNATLHVGRLDLSIGALSIGAIVANQDGSWTMPVTYTVTNSGTVTAQPNWWDLGYLSANGVLDSSSQSYNPLNSRTTALAPGASYTLTANFTTTTGTALGTYTLFVKADGHNVNYTGGTNTDGGSLVESSETNNIVSASVTLNRPDLTVSGLTVGTVVANSDGTWTIPVTYTVTNSGTVTAQPGWWDIGYLSANGVLDNSSQSNNNYLNARTTALAPGVSYTVTASFTTTTGTAPGTYTFFVKADGHNVNYTGGTNTDGGNLAEANEANNTKSASVTLH